LVHHLKDECSELKLKCPKECGESIIRKNYHNHKEECKQKDIQQENVTEPGQIIETTDEYYWTDKKFKLPLKISFSAMCKNTDGLVLSMFTAEKREWSGDSSPVALSWFMAANRCDFTFRTKIFGGFP
jgi:hypothetical protein